jgi:hypothetical protein
VKVSIDGRRETVYPPDVYSESIMFESGLGAWDDVLTRRPTDLALVSKRFPTFNLMRLRPGWTLLFEDGLAGLFAREGSSLAERIRRTPPPALLDRALLPFP